MPAGFKKFRMRGGDDFPSREMTLKEIRTVSKVAWEKWGPLIADYPLRDLIALAYAEGLYHGAVLAQIGKIDMTGMMAGSSSSAAASASLSETSATQTLSVRDLLESL